MRIRIGRGKFQVGLLAVVLMHVAAGLLIWVNMQVVVVTGGGTYTDSSGVTHREYCKRGWPYPFQVWIPSLDDSLVLSGRESVGRTPSSVHPEAFALDLILAALLIVLVGVVAQYATGRGSGGDVAQPDSRQTK